MSINVVRELLVSNTRRAMKDVLKRRSGWEGELQVDALNGADRSSETVADKSDMRDGMGREDGFHSR